MSLRQVIMMYKNANKEKLIMLVLTLCKWLADNSFG